MAWPAAALVGAQLVLVEHGNQVAGLNPLPVVDRQAHDAAGDLAATTTSLPSTGAGEHERLRTRTLEPPGRRGTATIANTRIARFMRRTSFGEKQIHYKSIIVNPK